jgi:septum site-determining protein MinC
LQPEAVVDIRYGQVGLVQVRVHTTDTGAILDELTGRVAAAPHFFRRTGVCLDLSALDHSPEVSEIQAVVDALRRAGMLAVGLSGEAEALTAVSAALGLPVLTTFRTPMRPVPIVQPATPSTAPASARGAAQSDADAAAVAAPGSLSAAAAAASILGTSGTAAAGITIAPPGSQAASEALAQAPSAAVSGAAEPGAAERGAAEPGASVADTADAAWVSQPALIHAQTVRSGQRVYGRGRDLIVTASVGPGAEVMADGCVHIYGALRGRVMAGTHGQLSARVFCQQFYAELVSIAGVFRVFETIPPELAGAPVQAWLAGDELRFARIG